MNYVQFLGVFFMGLLATMEVSSLGTAGVKILEWNGQNSLFLSIEGKQVWVDPFNLPANEKHAVDIVFITHDHPDHLDEADLNKVVDAKKTTVYTPTSCVDAVKKVFAGKVVPYNVGSTMGIGSVSVTAVPAYHLVKTDMHPKEKGWIGLLFSKGGSTLYITGDTERIPEMRKIKADVIILPLGQTYTFNSVQEAADVVKNVGAKIAIPVHYGMYEGTEADVKTLESLLTPAGIKVQKLEKKGQN